MMRVKALSPLASLVAAAVAIVALTATSESQADDNIASVVCTGGNVTVTSVNPGTYHLNTEAPWSWDKGAKVSLSEQEAKFKGDACAGTVKAYLCKNDKSDCRSVKVAV